MGGTTSTKKRINVTFPETVLDLLESVVPARKRNAFIVEATEEALRKERQLAAIQESSGAWSDEDHRDLMTVEDIDSVDHRLFVFSQSATGGRRHEGYTSGDAPVLTHPDTG